MLALILLLLLAFPRGGEVPPVARAAPVRQPRAISSGLDGIVAFARPHSLVLPTCQRPHVIAHRGGEF